MSPTGERPPTLFAYYCLCGEFVLACDVMLEQLPRRPLDQSYVLRCLDSAPRQDGSRSLAPMYKINASQGPGQILQRYAQGYTYTSTDGLVERQYDFHCMRCQLPLGYEHTPPPLKNGGKFTFLLPGALTYVTTATYTSDQQGKAPPDVMLDEMANTPT